MRCDRMPTARKRTRFVTHDEHEQGLARLHRQLDTLHLNLQSLRSELEVLRAKCAERFAAKPKSSATAAAAAGAKVVATTHQPSH